MTQQDAERSGPARRSRLPWTRIWAEAPVIIVSILLAFAIDAWWERRKEQSEVERYLQALRAEFESSRAQLDSVSAKNEHSIAASVILVSMTVAEAQAIPPDSASVLFARMMDSATFDPSLGVVSAVTAAGALSHVNNLDLRTVLGGWPGLVEDSREDAYPVFETALANVDHWATLGLGIPMLLLAEGLGREMDSKAFIVTLAGDSEARNRLATRAAFNRVYQRELDGLALHIRQVLTLLDTELGS